MDMPQSPKTAALFQPTPVDQRTSFPYHLLPQMTAVMQFMEMGGQTVNQFNPQQATMYLGLQCEELAEQLEVVAQGSLDNAGSRDLYQAAEMLKRLSSAFKQGFHMGAVMRCTHTDLLDGALDTAWVAFGTALSISLHADAAWREVARANFDKYPDGKVIRDANGKIQKPVGWRGPDLLPFVAQLNDKD
jgi:predicted HAD superfamily Cof-like phosphohydrolase